MSTFRPAACARDTRSAERAGVTLVGFARGDGFNVYAGAERIEDG